MKTTLQAFLRTLTCTLVCLVIFSAVQAKTLRVGYGGVALANVDYTSIDLAVAGALDGDTIQVYGSVGSGTITKRLVIQGFGYNLDVHPNLQIVNGDSPSEASLTFNTGSENTVLEGLTVYSTLNTGNIAYRRCKITGAYITVSEKHINNVKFLSSLIVGQVYMSGQDQFNCTNFEMFNCILQAPVYIYNAGSSGIVANCVTGNPEYAGVGSLNLYNSGFLVKNCILYTLGNGINTVFENNLFYQAQPNPLPAGSNNKWDQRWADVFNRLGGTDEATGYSATANFDENYYILKANSPARQAGKNGANAATDCGIFGGEPAYIYKISGVPAIPAVYKLTAPGLNTSTNPYNITISVRSNN